MKKHIIRVIMLGMAFALVGCGNEDNQSGASSEQAVVDKVTTEEQVDLGTPEEILNQIWSSFGENEKFAAGGGDSENMVMDKPGAFDVTKTEELDANLGLPADQATQITKAASLMHMMNANTFTGACYQLADGTDAKAFMDDVKQHIKERQWICGCPDVLVIINVNDQYVITAFGETTIMENFKNKTLETLTNAEVICEEPIQ